MVHEFTQNTNFSVAAHFLLYDITFHKKMMPITVYLYCIKMLLEGIAIGNRELLDVDFSKDVN